MYGEVYNLREPSLFQTESTRAKLSLRSTHSSACVLGPPSGPLPAAAPTSAKRSSPLLVSLLASDTVGEVSVCVVFHACRGQRASSLHPGYTCDRATGVVGVMSSDPEAIRGNEGGPPWWGADPEPGCPHPSGIHSADQWVWSGRSGASLQPGGLGDSRGGAQTGPVLPRGEGQGSQEPRRAQPCHLGVLSVASAPPSGRWGDVPGGGARSLTALRSRPQRS